MAKPPSSRYVSPSSETRSIAPFSTGCYEAAGGQIDRDLFAEEDERGIWFDDPDLLNKLAMDSLQAAARELETRWKWAEARLDVDWSATAAFGRVRPQPAEPTDEEKAEIERLRTRNDELANMYDDGWTEELVEEAESNETRLDEIEATIEARAIYPREDIAIAGCIATVGNDGELKLIQGLVRPEDMPAREAGDAAAPRHDDTADGEETFSGIDAPTFVAPLASPGDAEAEARKEAGVGIGLADDLRAIRTAIVKSQLACDFEAAFDLLLFQLARSVFTNGYHDDALDIRVVETPDRPAMRINDDAFGTVNVGEKHLEIDRAAQKLDWACLPDDDAVVELRALQAALDQILHRFGDEAVAEVTGRSRRVLRIADSSGERLALRNRPASANLAESAAFMAGEKRILVFSMAGGTGRSYHADLGCGNTARRIHYLLEPGWRADQAIQGLGRTHRTHQASAPLFRPVTTDVKGERRFIATIARRLDSLGAITRGQRDSQTAMGAGDATLFRTSDNLESPYAKVALRQFYIALWRGNIAGWSMDRFEDATGLKLIWEGSLKEDLPPMPRFLNRLLALPSAVQNELFAELETRIEANIEQAIEAGTHEQGVETIRADSLTVASRETVHVHEASGAATELVEIVRRDRLVPLAAGDALALRDGRPVINTRSKRAAVVLPAPSRMFEDGGVEARVRLVRPAAREPMAAEELAASNWEDSGEDRWRVSWDTEIEGLPSHTESRLWLVTGLLLPIWDRLPGENMRVRRLATAAGESLLGRVLTPEQAQAFRDAFGLAGGPVMSPAEMHEAILTRGAFFDLANGWRLARRRLMGAGRVEIEGPADGDLAALKRMGCTTEIVSWRTRVFVPEGIDLGRILDRWPLANTNPA